MTEGAASPLPGGDGDGGPTRPAVDDCYDVQAIAGEVLGLFATDGPGPPLYGPKPGIHPAPLERIAERHALPPAPCPPAPCPPAPARLPRQLLTA